MAQPLDNKKDSFAKEMEDDTSLIQEAIKSHGHEEILEDKTIDMVAAIVSSKLKGLTTSKQEEQEPPAASAKSGSIFGTAFTILVVVAMLTSIYGAFFGGPTPSGSTTEGVGEKKFLNDYFPDGKNSLFVGNFEFKRGNIVKMEEYSGRKSFIDEHVELITSYVEQAQILKKEEMDKMNSYTKQNFLLEGPPGTGKTIFVRRILTIIDEKLKEKYILSNGNEESEDLELKRAYETATPEKKKEILNKAKSRVVFCEVAPSTINNMYVGQSEKNVGLLFDTANKLGKDKHCAVFLFFDEGDVFFEERTGNSGNSGAGNVKSELLQRIGVMPSTVYLPVFVYCATNRPKVFDDAFKRRFGTHNRFDYPGADERREFIIHLFSDYEELKKEVLEMIVTLTVGKSQAYISSQMKEYYKITNRVVSGFKLRKFVEHLNKNKDNTNLG